MRKVKCVSAAAMRTEAGGQAGGGGGDEGGEIPRQTFSHMCQSMCVCVCVHSLKSAYNKRNRVRNPMSVERSIIASCFRDLASPIESVEICVSVVVVVVVMVPSIWRKQGGECGGWSARTEGSEGFTSRDTIQEMAIGMRMLDLSLLLRARCLPRKRRQENTFCGLFLNEYF